MKVEYSYRHDTVTVLGFSKYSLMKVPKAYSDSNLEDLNCTDEHCQQMWAFKDLILVQNHKTNTTKKMLLSR
jgi:hypothetical protein